LPIPHSLFPIPKKVKVFSSLDSQTRRGLLILFATGLFFWCGITTLLGTVPLYIESVGATKQQIGLVMGAFSLGLLPSRVWFGPLADARGRKLVLIVGSIVAAIAPLGYLFADSVPLLAAVRAFHGISIGGFTIGYSALVADLSPEGRRGELIGFMSLVNPIGTALGPAFGSFIQESGGYVPLFVTSAGLGALSLIGVFLIEEPDRSLQPQPKETGDRPLNFGQTLLSRAVSIPTFVMSVGGLIFGTIVSFLPLYLRQAEIDLSAGWFFTVVAIASLTVRLTTGRASDKYGRGVFITIGLICYSLCAGLLWTANSSSAVLLAAVFEGLAAGLIIPITIALMTDRCSPQERGKFFSICIGGFDVGLAIAGPIFGLLAEEMGYRNMFATNLVLGCLGIVVFCTLSNQSLSRSFKFALGRAKDVYAIERL
jgi:MFS family permease